jgi:release factor glutamine methyltransferase
LLFAYSLDISKEQALAMLPEEIREVPRSFFDMAVRRQQGESIAHIRGFKEFYGREFLVNDAVLSPRQDTEILVEAARECGESFQNPRVLDLCTGSGAVAISLAAERPSWRITASDISFSALELARKNAHRLFASNPHQPSIEFVHSDLFSSISGSFEMITANAPYVPHAEALRCINEGWKDPLVALDGGADGLALIRQIIAQGSAFLSENGVLLLEMDGDQIPTAQALFEAHNFRDVRTWKDLAGTMRVLGARRG